MSKRLQLELLELSINLENYLSINYTGSIKNPIELSSMEDIQLPYRFTCEALHPGTFKGYCITESEIKKAVNTIFNSEGNFHNYEINKDHKSSRKEGSSVDDLIGKVTDAYFDDQVKAYIIKGEIYDKPTAYKIANNLLNYVSLRINPRIVDDTPSGRFARELLFEELSFVRAPGDDNARIIER